MGKKECQSENYKNLKNKLYFFVNEHLKNIWLFDKYQN